MHGFRLKFVQEFTLTLVYFITKEADRSYPPRSLISNQKS